jgi:hypothetical protein
MTEKLPRLTTDAERAEIKNATRRALDFAGKRASFAAVTRVDEPALSKYCDPFAPVHFMPIDVACDLAKEVGAPDVFNQIVALFGYRLAPLDESDGCGETLGTQDVVTVAKEAGEAVAAVAALGGARTPEAIRTARREIGEAKHALFLVDRKLAGRA